MTVGSWLTFKEGFIEHFTGRRQLRNLFEKKDRPFIVAKAYKDGTCLIFPRTTSPQERPTSDARQIRRGPHIHLDFNCAVNMTGNILEKKISMHKDHIEVYGKYSCQEPERYVIDRVVSWLGP